MTKFVPNVNDVDEQSHFVQIGNFTVIFNASLNTTHLYTNYVLNHFRLGI